MSKHHLSIVFLLLALMAISLPAHAGEMTGRYLYTLSDFSGPESLSWVRVHTVKYEIFVLNPSDQSIHIFDNNGMEVFQFTVDPTLGPVTDVGATDSGDILLLTGGNGRFSVVRCNYRGEAQATLQLMNLPADYATGFMPSALACQGGRIYLVDKETMKVAVLDEQGVFTGGYDLGALIGMDTKKRQDSPIAGFSVDGAGNLLFTIPTSFAAYVVSPDRQVRSFGVKGSTPGKFNVIAGIAAGDRGTIFVVDALRCVIMAYDKDFTFLTEFGYRGLLPENLITPRDLAVRGDMLYVTQGRGRGVNVYRVAET